MKNAIFIYVGIVAVLFLLGAIITTFNTFKRLRNKVKQSKSTIDVYLTKRFDLIPNLVECVKGYAKYEESTFAKVVELRNIADNRLSKYLTEYHKLYPNVKIDIIIDSASNLNDYLVNQYICIICCKISAFKFNFKVICFRTYIDIICVNVWSLNINSLSVSC